MAAAPDHRVQSSAGSCCCPSESCCDCTKTVRLSTLEMRRNFRSNQGRTCSRRSCVEHACCRAGEPSYSTGTTCRGGSRGGSFEVGPSQATITEGCDLGCVAELPSRSAAAYLGDTCSVCTQFDGVPAGSSAYRLQWKTTDVEFATGLACSTSSGWSGSQKLVCSVIFSCGHLHSVTSASNWSRSCHYSASPAVSHRRQECSSGCCGHRNQAAIEAAVASRRYPETASSRIHVATSCRATATNVVSLPTSATAAASAAAAAAAAVSDVRPASTTAATGRDMGHCSCTNAAAAAPTAATAAGEGAFGTNGGPLGTIGGALGTNGGALGTCRNRREKREGSSFALSQPDGCSSTTSSCCCFEFAQCCYASRYWIGTGNHFCAGDRPHLRRRRGHHGYAISACCSRDGICTSGSNRSAATHTSSIQQPDPWRPKIIDCQESCEDQFSLCLDQSRFDSHSLRRRRSRLWCHGPICTWGWIGRCHRRPRECWLKFGTADGPDASGPSTCVTGRVQANPAVTYLMSELVTATCWHATPSVQETKRPLSKSEGALSQFLCIRSIGLCCSCGPAASHDTGPFESQQISYFGRLHDYAEQSDFDVCSTWTRCCIPSGSSSCLVWSTAQSYSTVSWVDTVEHVTRASGSGGSSGLGSACTARTKVSLEFLMPLYFGQYVCYTDTAHLEPAVASPFWQTHDHGTCLRSAVAGSWPGVTSIENSSGAARLGASFDRELPFDSGPELNRLSLFEGPTVSDERRFPWDGMSMGEGNLFSENPTFNNFPVETDRESEIENENEIGNKNEFDFGFILGNTGRYGRGRKGLTTPPACHVPSEFGGTRKGKNAPRPPSLPLVTFRRSLGALEKAKMPPPCLPLVTFRRSLGRGRKGKTAPPPFATFRRSLVRMT